RDPGHRPRLRRRDDRRAVHRPGVRRRGDGGAVAGRRSGRGGDRRGGRCRRHAPHPGGPDRSHHLGVRPAAAGRRDRPPLPRGWLTAPFALELMKGIGLEAIRTHNHGLAWSGAQLLAEEWGTELEAGEFSYGSMVTVPLPEAMGATEADASRLRDSLLDEDRI